MIGEGLLARRRPFTGRRTLGRRLPRPRLRLVLILLAVALVLAGGWFWFRDSSLVAVKRVRVSGVSSGPDAAQIRSALVAAAHNMTTLDVRMDRLRTAVAAFPVVKDLRVSTQFPHGMRIAVVEQVPVAAVTIAGRQTPVAADGTLLRDLSGSSLAALPVIPVRALPGGTHLTEPDAVGAVRVLAAAPYAMIGRVSQITTDPAHGLVAQLRNGPSIYFGDTGRLTAKWAALVAVLADPGSAGAGYIDLTDPARPAAGAGGAGTGTTATTAATTTTAGG